MKLKVTTKKAVKLQWKHVYVLGGLLMVGLEFLYVYLHLSFSASSISGIENWAPEGIKESTQSSSQRGRPPPPDGFFNGYPIYYREISTDHSKTTRLASTNNSASPSKSSIPYSQFHCIGETNSKPYFWKRRRKHVDMNWAYRSCHFEFLCLDLESHEFVIYPPHNPEEDVGTSMPHEHIESQQTVFTNVSAGGHAFGVAIGGINTKWSHEGYPRLHWFPRVEYGGPPSSFYALPSNVTLMPFHSLAAFNPGHLVWDDFLPLYTLAHIFGRLGPDHEYDNSQIKEQHVPGKGLQNSTTADEKETQMQRHFDPAIDHDLLLMRYRLSDRGLWAGCDWREDRTSECALMLQKFGPLMIRNPNALPITTQMDPNLILVPKSPDTNTNQPHQTRIELKGNYISPEQRAESEKSRKSNLVCARHALAGVGALTDHGVDKGHGWEGRDYESVYNHGRGGQLWRFRNFMMSNLGVVSPASYDSDAPPGPPYKIIFSERSSKMSTRSLDFSRQMQSLRTSGTLDILGPGQVTMESHIMKKFSLKEQAELVSGAALYVTGCGGGAMTATFLPRGGSLLVFYSGSGGVENNKGTGKPARLDWDYFNNMGYARVHWITQNQKDLHVDIQGFVALVRQQLFIMHEQWTRYQEERTSA